MSKLKTAITSVIVITPLLVLPFIAEAGQGNQGHHKCGGNSGQGVGNQCVVADAPINIHINQSGFKNKSTVTVIYNITNVLEQVPEQQKVVDSKGYLLNGAVGLFKQFKANDNVNVEFGLYNNSGSLAGTALANLQTNYKYVDIGITTGYLATGGAPHGVTGVFAEIGIVKATLLKISGDDNAVITVGFNVNY